MPIHGYPGNVITANPTAPTVSSASGVWTTEQQLLAVSQGNWPGYEYPIANSLRFNSADSAYLNRTPASASNRKTFTWSGWVKRGSLSSTQALFESGNGTGIYTLFWFTSSDQIQLLQDNGSGGVLTVTTNAVFRDPSAWYHIVIAFDTTQATSNNRTIIYVNGINQSLTYAAQLAQNADTWVNFTYQHRLGVRTGGTSYYNGYMTEINFIDGQALEPSSFGLNDPETGVWSPKRYTGTYGTNGFYLPMTTEGQWSGYFDGTGDKLTSSTNAIAATGEFSVEAWVYQTARTVTSDQHIFSQYTSGATSGRWYLRFNGTTVAFTTGLGTSVSCATTVNTGTWYHVCVTRDSSNRVRVFLNGVLDGTAVISGSLDTAASVIGATQTANYWQGYISNVRAVSGEIPTAYQTASTTVGATIFTPSTSQLTAVSGTSLLTCQSSTFIDNSGLGRTITTAGDTRPQQFSPFADAIDDRSGTGNHWFPNNLDLRTTGVGADIMVDSPTAYGTDTGVGGTVRGNYCTFNPLVGTHSNTYSDGNLQLATSTANAAFSHQRATFGVSSGKWYWEITCQATNTAYYVIGLASDRLNPDTQHLGNGSSGDGYLYRSDTGNKGTGGTYTAYGNTFTTGDIIGVAYDADNGKLWFSKNGTWQNSGSPSGGTNEAFSSITGTYYPAVTDFDNNTGRNSTFIANFGQRAFAYTAPSGFKALCTQNLPTPTIGATSTTQANDYFNAVLYTGNSSGASVTGVGFAPDFIWTKSRSNVTNHELIDIVRGGSSTLFSNLTNAEATQQRISAFGSDGWTYTTNSNSANTGYTFVGWNWKANGAGSSNTAGTITSTVSANTTSGFSIVTYTGTGANATVGHGLGAAPSMVIVKNRSSVTSWRIYHINSNATPQNYTLYFDTSAATAESAAWNNTAPTSSVFSVGTNNSTNTINYVAYCFAPVAGYSAFGKYTGNGSADGPFVYLGFRPRFIMFKMTSSTSNWLMIDTQRSQYNQTNEVLLPNSSSAEGTGAGYGAYDILSNGFKPRNSVANETNVNGGTYIYAAFAESPFKYSRAR